VVPKDFGGPSASHLPIQPSATITHFCVGNNIYPNMITSVFRMAQCTIAGTTRFLRSNTRQLALFGSTSLACISNHNLSVSHVRQHTLRQCTKSINTIRRISTTCYASQAARYDGDNISHIMSNENFQIRPSKKTEGTPSM
jgi:hypothetical protein